MGPDGKRTRVWYDPATGKREYLPDVPGPGQ